MTTAAQSRLIALRRNFDRSMAYFNVSKAAAHVAWPSAVNDIDKAERCYAAIARSLVNGKDGK